MGSMYNVGLGISFEQQPQSFGMSPSSRRPTNLRRRSSGSFERPPTSYQEALRRLPNTSHIPQMSFEMQQAYQQPSQPMAPSYTHSTPHYEMPRSAGPPQVPFASPPRRTIERSMASTHSAPNTPHADRRHRATKSMQHISPYPQRPTIYTSASRVADYSASLAASVEEIGRVPRPHETQPYMYPTPVMASPYSDYGHFTHVNSYNGSPVLMDSPVFGMDDDRVAYFDHLEVGMPEEPYVPPMQTNYPPRRPVFERTATENTIASFDTGYNVGVVDSPTSSPDPELLAIPSVRKKTTTYSRWSEEEDTLLRQAIAKYGDSKWSLVATCVPGRTPMQCSTRWQGALNTTIHKGKWEPEEDAMLIKAVAEWQAWRANENKGLTNPEDFGDDLHKSVPWGNLAATLPRPRTGVQALARWSEALDPRIVKGKWTAEEDANLMRGIQRFGKCWIKVAAAVRGRTQRQCRTRYVQITEKKTKERVSQAMHTNVSGGWSE